MHHATVEKMCFSASCSQHHLFRERGSRCIGVTTQKSEICPEHHHYLFPTPTDSQTLEKGDTVCRKKQDRVNTIFRVDHCRRKAVPPTLAVARHCVQQRSVTRVRWSRVNCANMHVFSCHHRGAAVTRPNISTST